MNSAWGQTQGGGSSEAGRLIRLGGAILGTHRHVCGFFNSHDDQYRVLLPFIKDGFECGEKAVHIIDPRGSCEGERLTYRIHRSMGADAVLFSLSGDLDDEHADRLQALLAAETEDHILLDLEDVTLVSHEAVRFLARVEATGIRIVNCPEYVRSWIAAENAGS